MTELWRVMLWVTVPADSLGSVEEVLKKELAKTDLSKPRISSVRKLRPGEPGLE